MKLNCKPGDLARVMTGENAGRLFEVLMESPNYGPGWWYGRMRGELPTPAQAGDEPMQALGFGHIEDSRLQPVPPTSSQKMVLQ